MEGKYKGILTSKSQLTNFISREYVNTILSKLPSGQLHLSSPISAVNAIPESPMLQVCTADGVVTGYDHVIFACHSDSALKILNASQGVTEEEKSVLGSFRWSKNVAVLHSDARVRREALSCCM